MVTTNVLTVSANFSSKLLLMATLLLGAFKGYVKGFLVKSGF